MFWWHLLFSSLRLWQRRSSRLTLSISTKPGVKVTLQWGLRQQPQRQQWPSMKTNATSIRNLHFKSFGWQREESTAKSVSTEHVSTKEQHTYCVPTSVVNWTRCMLLASPEIKLRRCIVFCFRCFVFGLFWFILVSFVEFKVYLLCIFVRYYKVNIL